MMAITIVYYLQPQQTQWRVDKKKFLRSQVDSRWNMSESQKSGTTEVPVSNAK